MDNSTIMCDEVIESYDEENDTISKNFMKMQNFYNLLAF